MALWSHSIIKNSRRFRSSGSILWSNFAIALNKGPRWSAVAMGRLCWTRKLVTITSAFVTLLSVLDSPWPLRKLVIDVCSLKPLTFFYGHLSHSGLLHLSILEIFHGNIFAARNAMKHCLIERNCTNRIILCPSGIIWARIYCWSIEFARLYQRLVLICFRFMFRFPTCCSFARHFVYSVK